MIITFLHYHQSLSSPKTYETTKQNRNFSLIKILKTKDRRFVIFHMFFFTVFSTENMFIFVFVLPENLVRNFKNPFESDVTKLG
jgi:hypothetical protein